MAKRYRTQKAFSCWDCGKVYLDKEFAQKCCAPKTCVRCGVSMDKNYPYVACPPCTEVRKAHRVKVVDFSEADDGVVFSDTHQGNWEDGYSSSIEEMEELHRDEGWEMPCYVHPCEATAFKFDPSDVLDRGHDEHHEDAADQLTDVDELFAFFEAWNSKQNVVSYWPKRDRVIVLDQARFQELLDQPKNSTTDDPNDNSKCEERS